MDTHVPPEINRCIVIAAPHTSNWDFWYAMASFKILKMPIRFTIKKEWMRFPFNLLIGPLGGIGIDRTPHGKSKGRISYTEAMINLFKEHKKLVLVITPEGTRKRNEHWKTGFYHVALGANVPICLGFIDYEKKKTGIAKTIYPSSMEKDMKEIMDFYASTHPKFPGQFSVDVHYA